MSAINGATAHLVTLTGKGSSTDFNLVGAAIDTISSNLPQMAESIQMLSALADSDEVDSLVEAGLSMCTAFNGLLSAIQAKSGKEGQPMLVAASNVGQASRSVLNVIDIDQVLGRNDQDILLALTKVVANNTGALFLKAQNIYSLCTDRYSQNRVSENKMFLVLAQFIYSCYSDNMVRIIKMSCVF